MKMKYYAALFFASSLLLTACKKEETAETTTDQAVTTTDEATPEAATPAVPTTGTVAPVTSVMYQNAGTQQNMTATQATTNVQSVQPAKVAPGMNPAHGQAGHRCDIAVGAPLNSAPNKPMTTTTTQNPAIITQMPARTTTTTTSSQSVPSLLSAPATTTTAPGMNPPHGQEGHKCDVAVGAPLPK
jgi:hypothetical protein